MGRQVEAGMPKTSLSVAARHVYGTSVDELVALGRSAIALKAVALIGCHGERLLLRSAPTRTPRRRLNRDCRADHAVLVLVGL